MTRPSIVILLSDEQRWDTLSCSGQQPGTTPNLDRMARAGVRFVNAFSSCPLCGPARATLQTGLYPSQTGCHSNNIALPGRVPTIADRLSSVGYETAYIGKWHLASNSHEGEECFWTRPIPEERRGGWRDYWLAADVPEYISNSMAGWLFDGEGSKVAFHNRYRADAYTDFALNYLNNRSDHTRPLLMMLSLVEPHAQPYHKLYQGPPPADRCRHEYREITYEGPEESVAEFAHAPLPDDLRELPGQAREFWPDYLAACNRVDWNVGRMMDALDQLGMTENTVVIFTSDHGCHFFSHLPTVAKCTEHESSIHIPMIARGPGFAAGAAVDHPVSLVDLAPSVLRCGSLEIPSEMSGVSLQQTAASRSERKTVRVELPGENGRVCEQGAIA